MTLNGNLIVVQQIFNAATCVEDVFGALNGDKMAGLNNQYRALLKTVHPDVNKGEEDAAAELLRQLNTFRDEAKHKIATSTYGNKKKVLVTKTERSLPRAELKVGKHTLVLNEAFAEGTFATLRYAEYKDDKDHFLFAKIARNAADSDLLDREYKALKEIWREDPVPAKEAYYKEYHNYTPYPVLTFNVMGTDGQKHKANLLSTALGERHTVQQLREGPFKSGGSAGTLLVDLSAYAVRVVDGPHKRHDPRSNHSGSRAGASRAAAWHHAAGLDVFDKDRRQSPGNRRSLEGVYRSGSE